MTIETHTYDLVAAAGIKIEVPLVDVSLKTRWLVFLKGVSQPPRQAIVLAESETHWLMVMHPLGMTPVLLHVEKFGRSIHASRELAVLALRNAS